jgi:hypothetical protein
MATTTPNNGWAVPTSTDLVTNGALAIETLGDAIDASVGTGLLAWQTYAPTLSGGWANGNGTYAYAKYAKLGKLVFFAVDFTIGSTTTKGTTMTMSLPVTAASSSMLFTAQGIGSISGTVYQTIWFGASTTSMTCAVLNSAGTYTTRTNITAAIPGTWATNDIFRVAGYYEAA